MATKLLFLCHDYTCIDRKSAREHTPGQQIRTLRVPLSEESIEKGRKTSAQIMYWQLSKHLIPQTPL